MKLELTIGKLLRWGVILSAAVVQAGGIAYLIAHGWEPAAYRVFHGEPEHLRSVGGILRGVLHLHSTSVIQLGLLILIATPIARVAVSLVAFAVERDRTYVAITALVLGILLYSLAGGAAG
ncbi:MAG: DUF1634 domain-containing protein [Bryobacteraceae bacterium]